MSSIFASLTTATVPVPFDPGQTITVRKLTGREFDAAQDAHRASIASGRSRSWSVTFRRMLEKGASDPDVVKAIADPLTGFDRFEVVAAGLLAWTYPQPVTGATRKATLEDLDDEAVDFIATEILKLTKPALFQTQEEAKAAQREADGSSPIA